VQVATRQTMQQQPTSHATSRSSNPFVDVDGFVELAHAEESRDPSLLFPLPHDSKPPCLLCRRGPRSAMLLRCGHAMVCYPCAMYLQCDRKPCPVCGRVVERVVQQ